MKESSHNAGRLDGVLPRPQGALKVSDRGGVHDGLTSGERLALNSGVRARRSGLHFPPELPFMSWQRIGKQLSIISDSSAWWLGDWLVYGQSRYGDRYKMAIAQTALDYQTLRNYAWVARRFEVPRRRDELSFQHHAEVAALSPDEQTVWLDRAQTFQWTRNRLRKELRAHRAAVSHAAALSPSAVVVRVTANPGQERGWPAAPARVNRRLDEWMASVLDSAANRLLGSAGPAHTPQNVPIER